MRSIRQLAKRYPVQLLCAVFDVTRSSYYAYLARCRRVNVQRLLLRRRVNELFTQSRSAAGSRSIAAMLQAEGTVIGRFKVRALMKEQSSSLKSAGEKDEEHERKSKKAVTEHLGQ